MVVENQGQLGFSVARRLGPVFRVLLVLFSVHPPRRPLYTRTLRCSLLPDLNVDTVLLLNCKPAAEPLMREKSTRYAMDRCTRKHSGRMCRL